MCFRLLRASPPVLAQSSSKGSADVHTPAAGRIADRIARRMSYRLSCQVARTPAGSPEAAKQLSAVHRHLSTRRALAASGLHALLGARGHEVVLLVSGFCGKTVSACGSPGN